MIRRIVASILLLWFFGLVVFIITLPGPAKDEKTEAIVVLTGGKGRIDRGIDSLKRGLGNRMLVSGVYPRVTKSELAAVQNAPRRLFRCCIDLGKQATDTRTNADETARWLRANKFTSVRLVTTDWHMPRARFELEQRVDRSVIIVEDAVESSPGLLVLIFEYQKLLARRAQALVGL